MEARTQNRGATKSWEEDIYWTHFQFIHFTQFLSSDFQQQLALPKTFSDNLKNLPENVTLKGPSGVVWNVGLTTSDSTLYFTNGWQQFVKDQSLKENDFLVFKYNGKSHFEVLIFDGDSLCEKATSYFVGKCGHAQTEQGGTSKTKDTNTSSEEEVINSASNGGVECGSPEKFQRLNSGNAQTEQVKEKDTNNSVEEFNTASNGGVECGLPEKFQRINSGNAQTEQGGSKVNDTNNLVEEFNIASNGGVECGSPEKFQHLNSGNAHTEQGVCKGKDTNNYVEDVNTASNGAVKGFTPVKFRSVNSIRTPLAARCGTSNEKTTPAVFNFHTTGKRTKRPFNEDTSILSKRRKRSPKAANSWEGGLDWLTCNKEHSEAAIMNRSGKEDDYYMLSGASLSMLSTRDEKKIAQLFISSFPYFVKIIRSFNVNGPQILNVPHKFSMEHLPNCKTKIILHNLKGEHWTVNSVARTRVHTNHTICGGWLDFIRGNGIKVGDVCIFELIRECELRVRIAEIGKDGLDSHVGKLAFSMLNARRHDVACHKTSRHIPKNPKVSSMCRNKVDLSDKKSSKIGQGAALSILKKYDRTSNTSKKMGISPKSKAVNKKSSKIGQGAALSILKKYGRASNTSKKTGISPKSKAVGKKLVTLEHETKTVVRRKHRVEKEPSSEAKAGSRTLSALGEKRVAEAFNSPFPFFVKIMKMFNVSGSLTLKIPIKFAAAHLPASKTEVTLRNSRGKCWTVNAVPDTKLKRNHTFCGGWNTFVRENDINIGDTCIFELVSQYVMQVYITGVGKEAVDHQNSNVKLNS